MFAPSALVMLVVARASPDFAEWYAKTIYPIFVKTIGALTSLLPFSLAEILVYVAVMSVIGLIAWLVIQLIRRRLTRTNAVKLLRNVMVTVSSIFMAYTLFCGINNFRYKFSEQIGLTIELSSVSQLKELCLELVKNANQERANILTCWDVTTIKQFAQQAVNALSDNYPVMFKAPIKAKSVLYSVGMSHMNITGIFFPFTLESNINVDVIPYSIPATTCHELAHTRGFMREDEANFIAYLACRESDDPQVRYSGEMLALVHSMNRLYAADSDAFMEVYTNYSDGVRKDFADNSAYWKQFEGTVAEISSKVNDTYLKANDQDDGVQSYGRMVDLLLADYRKRNIM